MRIQYLIYNPNDEDNYLNRFFKQYLRPNCDDKFGWDIVLKYDKSELPLGLKRWSSQNE